MELQGGNGTTLFCVPYYNNFGFRTCDENNCIAVVKTSTTVQNHKLNEIMRQLLNSQLCFASFCVLFAKNIRTWLHSVETLCICKLVLTL